MKKSLSLLLILTACATPRIREKNAYVATCIDHERSLMELLSLRVDEEELKAFCERAADNYLKDKQ
jgi:hypothetical protein